MVTYTFVLLVIYDPQSGSDTRYVGENSANIPRPRRTFVRICDRGHVFLIVHPFGAQCSCVYRVSWKLPLSGIPYCSTFPPDLLLRVIIVQVLSRFERYNIRANC